MAKSKDKTPLTKTDWVSRFNLLGKAVVNDYTFKMDQRSEKSNWIYNVMNLDIDCGEKHGKVRCELMGGYGADRENVIYVHGKDENDRDDFDNRYTIAWEDRFDESILEDIGDLCFIEVGVEKDSKGGVVYSKFLSAYDVIKHLEENLEDGTVVSVSGQLRYQLYNGTLQCRKEVGKMIIPKNEVTEDKFHSTFTQSMLLDPDSCTKKSIDKDKSVLTVDAYLLEKFKEYNGYDLTNGGKTNGQFIPLRKMFEFPVDIESEKGKANTVKIIDKLFKVKKGTVTQMTFDGEFVESGATVQATVDDLTEDLKDLIDMGLMTEEEALAKCADGGSKERRMLLTKPYFKRVGDDDNRTTVMQKFEERFSEDDLFLDCLVAKEEDEEEEGLPFKDETTSDGVTDGGDAEEDWLSSL